MDDTRRLLRHFLAALAYRTQKALRSAPHSFGDFRAAPGVRTPHQLIHHMSGVLLFALSHFEDTETWVAQRGTLSEEVAAFHAVLEAIGRHLDVGTPFRGITPERMLQGPLADAMTHAGQLAMMRRLAGSPIPPEDFSKADVHAENLGTDQAAPRSPDADWRDAEGRHQRSDGS